MPRLSSAATLAIRRAMRSRPGCSSPLPPPGGTRAFWLEPHHGAGGGVVAQGPAVWSRQQDGDSPGVWGATPSDAIRRAFGWRGTRRPLTRAPGELIATLEYDLVFFGRRAPHPDVDEEAPS